MPLPSAKLVPEIETRARSASLTSLFLDFDGTLVPIAANRAAPRLDPGGAAVLKLLSRQDGMPATSAAAPLTILTRIRLEVPIYAPERSWSARVRRPAHTTP